MLDLVRDLSLALREQVLPHLGSHAARAHEDAAEAAGGDVTFAIDAGAEAGARGVPRRARSRSRVLLRGPWPGRAGGRRRGVGPGRRPDRRDPARAGRLRGLLRVGRRRAARRRAHDGRRGGRLHRRDPVGQGVPRRARARASWNRHPSCCRATSASTACSVTYGFRGRPARALIDGDRRPDRRRLGRRRHLRARFRGVRHDPRGDGPARRLRRAGAAHGRRRARHGGRVQAGRRRGRAQQLPLRPGRGAR